MGLSNIIDKIKGWFGNKDEQQPDIPLPQQQQPRSEGVGTEHLFRTNSQNQVSRLYRSEPHFCLAQIYTDFVLTNDYDKFPNRYPVIELDEKNRKKVCAYIETFRPDNNSVSVYSKNGNLLASFDGTSYTYKGKTVEFRKLEKTALSEKVKNTELRDYGITRGYFFEENTPLDVIYCFHKDTDISRIIKSEQGTSDLEVLLAALPICLYDRVAGQEYIKDFLLPPKEMRNVVNGKVGKSKGLVGKLTGS